MISGNTAFTGQLLTLSSNRLLDAFINLHKHKLHVDRPSVLLSHSPTRVGPSSRITSIHSVILYSYHY